MPVAEWKLYPVEDTYVLPYPQTMTRTAAPCPTPRARARIVHRETGEAIPARCRRLACIACAPIVVKETAAAIDLSRPDYFVTISRAGTDWASVHQTMTALKRLLKARSVSAEWAYCVEPHRDPPWLHVHMWVRAPRAFRLRLVQEVVAAIGVGPVVHLADAREYNTAYPMKMLLWADPQQAATYLGINGGKRLVHSTRAFWRDREGRSVGLAEARRIAVGRSGGGPWMVVFGDT
jgi:hypothetical protein